MYKYNNLYDQIKSFRNLNNYYKKGSYGEIYIIKHNQHKYICRLSVNYKKYNINTINQINKLQNKYNIKIIPKHIFYYKFNKIDILDIVIMENINCTLNDYNLTHNEWLFITQQLENIIKLLHCNNIAHGDLNERNILLDHKLNIYLIDFEFSYENNNTSYFNNTKKKDLLFIQYLYDIKLKISNN
jgi:serine/threonine protein kinase